jgi:hypothetical protein
MSVLPGLISLLALAILAGKNGKSICCTQGADPSPLPLQIEKAGKNHLNEEITPLLLTEID